MRWDAFEQACPDIATRAVERFRADELVMLGTLRIDGSPRVSPCELDFAAGRLFLGMMWRSKKAVDVLRDPRVAVHSVPSDRMNPGGDVKLYGHVVDEAASDVRAAFLAAIKARIDWQPDEPYHLFSLDVASAGYTVFGEPSYALAWDPSRGLRRLELQ